MRKALLYMHLKWVLPCCLFGMQSLRQEMEKLTEELNNLEVRHPLQDNMTTLDSVLVQLSAPHLS